MKPSIKSDHSEKSSGAPCAFSSSCKHLHRISFLKKSHLCTATFNSSTSSLQGKTVVIFHTELSSKYTRKHFLIYDSRPKLHLRQEKKSRRKLCLTVLIACVVAFVLGAGLTLGIVFLTKRDSSNSGTLFAIILL